MAELRRDPSLHELLDRIRKLEAWQAQTRKDLDQLYQSAIHVMNLRDSDRAEVTDGLKTHRIDIELAHEFITKLTEIRQNDRAEVTDRLSILEDKIFPGMGPMIQGIEKIVGEFNGWNLNNLLDRRQGGDQKC